MPEKFRIKAGPMASRSEDGNIGAFEIKLKKGQTFFAIASGLNGWEHVSVSRSERCPTWDEMCQIKDMFWEKDACVVQYHPAQSDYINNHPYCLHLWRPTDQTLPFPPRWMVGLCK